MNNGQIIVEVLALALQFAQRVEAIARKDPAVWAAVKDDFNKAKADFTAATGANTNEAD